MTKNVIVFGATGRTGAYIVRRFQQLEDVNLSLFARTPSKLADAQAAGATVIQGDATNPTDVERALQGQNIVLVSLEGNVLEMARNIVAGAKKTGVRRIIWITGMGIRHEIKGMRGMMLNALAKSRPDYVEAADLIANSGIDYTLLRCPMINDGDNATYHLTDEGEQPRNKSVDRAAIAQAMADMVANESLGRNKSVGITN